MKRLLSYLVLTLTFSLQNQAIAYNPPMTPKSALQRLMEGNKRFTKDSTISPDRAKDRRLASAERQRPFAIVLGCSDSRIPPELAFDQGIGDIFVVRVAGNVVGETELASIEYSAIHNHSAIIIVLGHEDCGAVKAVINNKTEGIEAIAALIQSAVTQKPRSLEDAVERNIRNSVRLIKQAPPIAQLMQAGKIDVIGAFYHLNTGKVRLLSKEK